MLPVKLTSVRKKKLRREGRALAVSIKGEIRLVQRFGASAVSVGTAGQNRVAGVFGPFNNFSEMGLIAV